MTAGTMELPVAPPAGPSLAWRLAGRASPRPAHPVTFAWVPRRRVPVVGTGTTDRNDRSPK